MKTIEYRTLDKSTWPKGPWIDEPDKKQWQDEETGLPCLIVRVSGSGHLCGYVGVLPGHPYYEDEYNNHYDLDAHSGLTFSSHCSPGETEDRGICHIAPGEPEPWWFGFDCAHGSDFSHFARSSSMPLYGEYRDVVYVTSQCRKLAKQLKEVPCSEAS